MNAPVPSSALRLDLDSHIQPSPDTYPLVAGEIGLHYQRMFEELLSSLPADQADRLVAWTGDEKQEWTDDTVWTVKGSTAPGAVSPEGRLKTLDHMGVRRSLIFSDPGVQSTAMGAQELALATMRHWNDFILDFNSVDRDRLRGVAVLNTNDISTAIGEAERVLKAGGAAFVIPSSTAPGGRSPACPEMDPLWAMIAEANAAVTLHAGGEEGFLASNHWDDGVDHLKFESIDYSAEGEQIGTYQFASMSLAPQNFLTVMTLGGVFERHPNLRFGVIELGAHWLAPMSVHMDNTALIFGRRFKDVLSMKPSEYIRRNVRVTPFRVENVADYVERYGMAECYCYSSDFPHPEGGQDPVGEFQQKIDRLGNGFFEQFFCSNGEWLLPELN
ncbi:MAG: amidohydrolase family protein [Congregibacter sp.]